MHLPAKPWTTGARIDGSRPVQEWQHRKCAPDACQCEFCACGKFRARGVRDLAHSWLAGDEGWASKFDQKLQGWFISPDDIQICKHGDGEDWLLASLWQCRMFVSPSSCPGQGFADGVRVVVGCQQPHLPPAELSAWAGRFPVSWW